MVTMDALQRGLQVVETVENSREALEQANSSMTEVLIGQKDAGDYLHFALALDEVRKYAAGKRFVPGFPIYEATQPLIKKMEELDSLIAGQRAGLPDRVENPFIFSQLSQSLETFASSIELNCGFGFTTKLKLESEEFELLQALESMRRRFELPDQRSWRVVKKAVPTMEKPVEIDDGVIDDLKLHWTRKSRTAQLEALRRETLAGQEGGRARLLLDSRKAALEEEKLQQSKSQVPDPSLSRPWLMYFSLVNELRRYLGKYEDSMDNGSADAIKQRLSEVVDLDDMMAGPDSDPQAVEPSAEKVEAYLTSTVWPNLVKHFGSYEPTSKISEGDSRLFRIMYELQNTLALPEKVEGADMRRIYNYTEDPDRREEPWPDALKVAHAVWNNALKHRSLNLEKQERTEKAKEVEGKNASGEQKEETGVSVSGEEPEKKTESSAAEISGEQKEETGVSVPGEEPEKKTESNTEEISGEVKAVEDPERDNPMETLADFEQYMKEREPEVRKMREQQLADQAQEKAAYEKEREKYRQPPTWEGKTWGAFTEELETYLKYNVRSADDLNPRMDNPRPRDYPHIGPITQFLVGRKRFGSEELKNSIIDSQELTREANNLLNDPGFGKLLKDEHFRFLLSWRGADAAWGRIMEESEKAHEAMNAQPPLSTGDPEGPKTNEKRAAESPLAIDVLESRKQRENEREEEMKPIQTAVERVYLRLTDERYNADIRKTGFLFFKPSDTGFYQTAVGELKKLYDKKGQYQLGELNDARRAVKAYLDERKDVRSHEYGKRRWEKMMCAYKALALPGDFEKYCKELNDRRGIKETDTLNPNYVHPSAFGAERMDLVNPRVPMNEAYRQLRQDYARDAAAGKKDALLDYFSKIAAMRTQTARINGDWGTLVDMNLVAEQAEMLKNDTGFINAFNKGKGESDRKAMFAEAGKILDPDHNNWEKLRESPAEPQNKKTNEISKG